MPHRSVVALALLLAGAAPTGASYVVRDVPTPIDRDARLMTLALPPVLAAHAGDEVAIPVAALGANGIVAWSSTGLPEGLSVADGLVTGATDLTGVFAVTIEARDESHVVARIEAQLVLLPGMSVSVPEASLVAGASSSTPPAFVTGEPVLPLRFSVASGSLPPGLRLDWRTGSVSGTPTTAGAYAYALHATDAVGGRATSDPARLVVRRGDEVGDLPEAPGFVVAAPASIPTRVGGSLRSPPASLTGTPLAPVTWSLVEPVPGVDVDAEGRLVGTPTDEGTFSTEVKAVDAAGATAYSAVVTITVGPSLALSPVAPLDVRVGADVEVPAPAVLNGPRGRVTWSAGGLPPGLAVDPASGTLAGHPTEAGVSLATVVATDEDGFDATGEVRIGVTGTGPSSASSVPLSPTFHVGATRVPLLSRPRGGGVARYAVRSAALPSGATVDPATGDLLAPRGFPGPIGEQRLELLVTDGAGEAVGSVAVRMTVLPRYPVLDPGPRTPVEVGRPATLAPPALPADVDGPLAWSVAGGVLPEGMSLDPATGAVSGSPRSVGSFPWGLRAVDRRGATLVTRVPAPPLVVAGPSIGLVAALDRVVHADRVTIEPPALAGDGPRPRWSLLEPLPAGLYLRDGVVSGTLPWVRSSFRYVLRATDPESGATTTTRPISVTVLPPVDVGRVADLSVVAGRPLGFAAPTLGNAVGAVTWSASALRGSLDGLRVDPATGDVSGALSRPGRYRLSLVATDAAGGTGRSDPFVVDVFRDDVQASGMPAMVRARSDAR